MEQFLAKKSIMDPELGVDALAPKTISSMRTIIESFQRTCHKTRMKEVTGQDLVGYFSTLRLQANIDPADPNRTEKLRKRNVTVKNHYATLHAFFKQSKINIADMLEPQQIPRCKGRKPEAFTDAELSKLWVAANREEKIRLQFFCVTGFRKKEVAHLTWADIDLETGMVKVTPKDGWRRKNKRPFEIGLPAWLTVLLRERREDRPGDRWVFPSATGMVARCNQLLLTLKDVARRAGVTGRVDLHNFRSTYASMLNEGGNVTIEEISARLGHADTTTTRVYLEGLNQNTERARKQTDDTFAKLAR
jgi:integrase